MKLLCICDPSLYTQATQDVPTTYRQFAQHPDIEFFHAPASEIQDPDRVTASPVQAPLNDSDFWTLDQNERYFYHPSEFDLVFCRRLKPFPDHYLDLLSQWAKHVRFINAPQGKLIQMQPSFLQRIARDYIPDTLVTANCGPAQTFWERHQVIVLKKANSTGGRGVYKLWFDRQRFWLDNSVLGTLHFPTFSAAFQSIQTHAQEQLQLVRYLPTVTRGDKRIVVVDGEIYGAYIRRSQRGYWVNNVSVDGQCHLADVSVAEQQAIEQTVGYFQALGLHTLGYDFLQDEDGAWRISEINAGNIGGFARLEMLTGAPVVQRLIAWMLQFSQHQFRLGAQDNLNDGVPTDRDVQAEAIYQDQLSQAFEPQRMLS